MKRLIIFVLLMLVMVGCDYDRFNPITEFVEPDFVPNADLYDIRHSFGAATVIPENIIVKGRVVSSDRAGNFYRTLVIDDGTSALELMLGMDYLYHTYPVGVTLTVRLQGLAIDEYNGVLRVGLRPDMWDYRSTAYMSHQAIADRYIYRTTSVADVAPATFKIDELTPRMCGRLVKVEGLLADEPDKTWSGGRYDIYRKFRTVQGDSIYVETSSYALYADQPLPKEHVSITGVLYYGAVAGSAKAFIIKMNDETNVTY